MRKRRRRMIHLQCYNINPNMGKFPRVIIPSAIIVRVSCVPIFCSALQKSRLIVLTTVPIFLYRSSDSVKVLPSHIRGVAQCLSQWVVIRKRNSGLCLPT
jgi:hypothetical protein